MNAVREIPKRPIWQILHPFRIVSNLIDTIIFPNYQRFPPPFFLKRKRRRKKHKRSKENRIVIECHPSFPRDLGLSAWRSAWASVSTSGPIEDDRSRPVSPGTKSPRLTWGFEPLEKPSARRRAKRKPCGGREEEGEDKWPGRVSPLKRSSGVSSVEAEWPKAHSPPLWPSSPLVLVSSWKSIAGKRVKIHPCLRERTWLRGGLARLEAV